MGGDGGGRRSVFVLHNQISPYRLPLFEALTRWYAVVVYFVRVKSSYRKWETSLESNTFEYVVGSAVGLGGIQFNYDLVKKLLSPFDVYIIASVNVSTGVSVLLTWAAAKLHRKPLVFWVEFVETDYHTEQFPLKKRLGDVYRKALARQADRCIAFSEMTETYLLDLGVDESKIVTTAQVMPFEQLHDVEETETETDDAEPTTILSLGYLKPNKGNEHLIRAFRNLDPDDARLLIAGDGPELESLRELAAGRDDICFPGYMGPAEKATAYTAADVFVLPTEHDSWGLVTNEAMYYGLPVIVTESAGSRELVDDNGLVVEAGSVSALEDGLQALLSDPDRRAVMAERSRERIAEYDIDRMVSAFREAIEAAG